MTFLLRFGLWYALAAWQVTWGTIALASRPSPLWTPMAAVILISGVWVAVNTAQADRRCRHTAVVAMRQELLGLLRERAGTSGDPTGWLDRDEHLMFAAWREGPRWLRRWLLSRADEDQARLLQSPGRVAVTADLFFLMPWAPDVMHQVIGAMAVTRGDGNTELEEQEKIGRLRYLRQFIRAERAGMLYAGEPELRELIARFREAERVDVPK